MARTDAMDALTKNAGKNTAPKNDAPKNDAPKNDAPKNDAPKSESVAAKVSRTAPLDLSALTVEAAPAPVKSGGGRTAADNSVAEGWLRDSWNARENGAKIGAGKAVTVPTAAVGTLKSRLNRAAASLMLGVAIDVTDAGNNMSRVTFAAKVRKQKRSK